MEGDDRLVLERIEALLEAPADGEAAPTLARMEATLTDGYAEALALEAERSRIERRIGEAAGRVDESASVIDEIVLLARRLTSAEGELGHLRAMLRRLHARTREQRHA